MSADGCWSLRVGPDAVPAWLAELAEVGSPDTPPSVPVTAIQPLRAPSAAS